MRPFSWPSFRETRVTVSVQMLRVAFSLFRSVRVSWFLLEETLKIQRSLTLILPTWRIRWAPNNASKWQIGFNSAFKGLIQLWGRGSVVGIAVPCGLEYSGFETRWRQEILPYPHTSRPALGRTYLAVPWVPGQSARDKATGAWPWPPLSI